MKKSLQFKSILISWLFLLCIFSVITPIAHGYGSSIDKAQRISNGSYNFTLYLLDYHAYFKIYCSFNDSLFVKLVNSDPAVDVNLELYGPSQAYIASDSVGSTMTLLHNCSTEGWYYIHARKGGAEIGSADLRLSVSGATGTAPIPGFEMIYMLIALIFIGFLIQNRLKSRKKHPLSLFSSHL